jgi:enoyl-CoA hydratase
MNSILYEIRDGVAEISLARPPVNALDESTLVELLAAFRQAATDQEARAVILHSAIQNRFCAGLDLKILHTYQPSQLRSVLQKLYVDLFDAQFALGKPSIAAVSGATRGGGMTVAVSCDLVVASRSATFGYPEIDSGLLPAIHYAHLPRIVGRHRAFDLLFTGRTFSAQEALDVGLINRIVDDAEVLDAARQLALSLMSKPAETVRRGRAAFMSAIDHNYRRDIQAAVEQFCNVALTEEAQEGLKAYLEGRKPAWRSGG